MAAIQYLGWPEKAFQALAKMTRDLREEARLALDPGEKQCVQMNGGTKPIFGRSGYLVGLQRTQALQKLPFGNPWLAPQHFILKPCRPRQTSSMEPTFLMTLVKRSLKKIPFSQIFRPAARTGMTQLKTHHGRSMNLTKPGPQDGL